MNVKVLCCCTQALGRGRYDAGAKSCSLVLSDLFAADTIVGHRQLNELIVNLNEFDANLAASTRLGVLESIGHPLSDNDPKTYACICSKSHGLNVMRQFGAEAIRLHGGL